MLARRLDGRAVGRGDERPQPGIGAHDVIAGEGHVERRVDRGKELVHLPARGRRTRRRALEQGVRRADQPVLGPRDQEDDLTRDPDGQPGLVRDPVPRHDQVGAPARQDLQRGAAERMAGLGRPDAGGIDHGPGQDLVLLAGRQVADLQLVDAWVPAAPETRRPQPRDRDAAGGLRGPDHGHGVACVVLDAVVVEQATAEAVASEGRREVERLDPREAPMPAAVVPGAEDVVQGQSGVVEGLRQVRQPVDREEQRLDPDEVRGQRQQVRALGEGLADQAEPELLEVAQPAVDQPGRARRRPGRDVVLLHERRPHPARDRIEQRSGADDPTADDDHVPRLGRECCDVRAAALERAGMTGGNLAWLGGHWSGASGRCLRDPPQPPARSHQQDADCERSLVQHLGGARNDLGQDRQRRSRRRPPPGRPGGPGSSRAGAPRDVDQPRSAAGGMPIGATRTLPA